MLILWLITFVCALLACGIVVLYTPQRWRCYPADRPQRFHTGHVPRLGGLAVGLVFWMVGLLWVAQSDNDPRLLGHLDGLAWWLSVGCAMMPVWLVGVIEDLTQNVRPRWRLLMALLSAIVTVYLLDLRITRVGVDFVDQWWIEHPWIGVGLALLALTAMPHAINFIDGYNGLASTVILMVGMGLMYVALKVADWYILAVVVCLLGVTAGFWFWNYPKGLLFAGDGGAYFWGWAVAMISIALVQRNPQVSPWFPVLLLAYPLVEVIFSVYRKMARGQSPTLADALHFHQLIYRRLVRGVVHDDVARKVLMRNNRTSPYLWGVATLAVLPAVIFWSNTVALIACFSLFAVGYVSAYSVLISFRVPRWIRRR